MAKSEKKLLAFNLRRKGESIKSIAEQLGVSKGSVSTWCRDIVLTKKQKNRLRENAIKAGHRGRMIGAQMNKQKKQNTIAKQECLAKEKVGSLSDRDIFMLGIGLYWGEGVKADKSTLAIVNSDPEIILLMYHWFQKILGIQKDRFRPYI